MNIHVRILVADVADRSRQIADLSLLRPCVTIGRTTQSDVALPDASVSRRHAQIVWADDSCQIHDLGSDNGVALNGVRINQSRLRVNDVIQVGRFTLQIAHLYCSSDEETTKRQAEQLHDSSRSSLEQDSHVVRFETLSKPLVAMSWIHLSDLHFGAGTAAHCIDQDIVLRAIERDMILVRDSVEWLRPIDRVFVTGDIAFSAHPEQYSKARKWFDRILNSWSIPHSALRLTPGNHDIDRSVAKSPVLRSIHETLRARPEDLEDYLADRDARAQLSRKLDAYIGFLQAVVPDHPGKDSALLDWAEDFDSPRWPTAKIRLVGLCTVWVSDSADSGPPHGAGNLLLARAQRERTFDESRGILTMLLTHHPPEWLAKPCRQHLAGSLARRPHIHLCGHVHEAAATSQRRFGVPGPSFRYVAGAAHDEPGGPVRHGYSVGALRAEPSGRGWQVGWSPRVFVPETEEMRADSTTYRLDSDGFAWEPIELSWPQP